VIRAGVCSRKLMCWSYVYVGWFLLLDVLECSLWRLMVLSCWGFLRLLLSNLGIRVYCRAYCCIDFNIIIFKVLQFGIKLLIDLWFGLFLGPLTFVFLHCFLIELNWLILYLYLNLLVNYHFIYWTYNILCCSLLVFRFLLFIYRLLTFYYSFFLLFFLL